MIYNILGSFCSSFNWEGASIHPESGLGKSLLCTKIQCQPVHIITINLQKRQEIIGLLHDNWILLSAADICIAQ